MTISHNHAGSFEAAQPPPETPAPGDPHADGSTVVNFVPRWPGNPYHAELSKHLSACGVHVGGEDRLKNISRANNVIGKMPNIIHIHAIPRFNLAVLPFLRFFMFWIRMYRLQILGIRLVWTIHDCSHHEALYPRVDLIFSRMLFRRADAIIVHSDAARKAVVRQWNMRRDDNLFVIPHGNYIGSYPNSISRRAAREKLRVPSEKIVFLFLGMIRPYKGVPDLIETFKGLTNDSIHLLIAGMPISEKLSGEILSAIGDCDNIHYHPYHIDDDQMQDYLNAADAVVFPYTKALTSGALILGMSFRRACIAPKMGALGDTLDESGGFLYDPSDAGGLREAMEKAIRERTRLEDMGEYNRRKAEGWTWNEVARMTADVYKRCLSGEQNG